LVFEQLRQWRIMVERWIGGALGIYRTNIPGKCASRNGGGVSDGDNGVYGRAATNFRPLERLQQRLRQR
jgi:hypothetical protein